MRIRDFQIERYFAEYEFTVPHHLSASDCESMEVGELLELAGESPDQLLRLRLGYTESRGDPALREVVAGHYPGCAPGDVIVTNAPEEAIFIAMHTLLEPGDRVVVQMPCYQSLAEIARSIGCEVIPWTVVETDDGWGTDLDELARIVPAARLLVINAPHNPTGHQPTAAERMRVMEIARTNGVRVFSDEMYRGLERSPELALRPAASTDERALSLWGTSKSFGLPGLRIGWLVCRDRELMDRIAAMKDYTTICSSAPGELLTRVALENADALLERNRRLIRTSVRAVGELIDQWPDRLSWHPPQAGPVALVRVHGETATELCARARREAGVLLLPSGVFDMDDRHVRVGLGRAGVGETLERLGRVMTTA